MQVSASLNLKNYVYEYSNILENTPIGLMSGRPDVDHDKAGRKWVIDTKFETPILNFDYDKTPGSSATNAIAIPTHGSASVSIGMWHQYGTLPKNSEEGIVVEINDVPNSGSLADALGLRRGTYKLGQTPLKKEVKEAVVAIPFRTINGQKLFFKIPEEKIKAAVEYQLTDNEEKREKIITMAGKNTVEMVQKMKDYIFPPKFDFLTFNGSNGTPSVEPIAMCIFEFKHEFEQQDLIDMWQNLAPKLGYSIKEPRETQASISHPLFSEIAKLSNQASALSLKKDVSPETNNPRLNFFDVTKDLRWMVFKVKQKAATNYYNVLKKSRGDIHADIFENDKFASIANKAPHLGLKQNVNNFESKEISPLYSYNWPYDYFTMIELAQVEASIEMAPENLKEQEGNRDDAAQAVADSLQKVFNIKD